MDDATRHPDDAALLDFAEGTLEPAPAELVERHVALCSACAALVAAARSGRDAATAVTVELPADRAEQLAAAVRAAWRERRDRTLADEQAVGDGPAVESTEVLEAIPTGRPMPRSRRTRRLVPILAFGVLATLAGTSVYIGEDRGARPDRATPQGGVVTGEGGAEAGRSAPNDEAARDGAGGAAAPAAPSSAPVGAGPIEGDPTASTPPVAPGAPSDTAAELAAPELEQPASGGAEATGIDPREVTETERAAQALEEPTCFATRDEAALVLPDGRIPQRVERGPLGIYLVCG